MVSTPGGRDLWIPKRPLWEGGSNLTGEDGALGRFEFVAACEAGKTCQLQFLFIGREEFSMVVCPTRWDMESKDRCQR